MKKSTRRKLDWAVIILFGSPMVASIWIVFFRPGRADLLADGTLALELVPAPGTHLPHAHARPDGETLRVTGRLRREPGSGASDNGQLEITLLSPGGEVLEQAIVDYRFSETAQKGGGAFVARFDAMPPDGSTVRMKWGASLRRSEQNPAGEDGVTVRQDVAASLVGGLP